jgi:thioesterase domain-containing protein
MYATGDRARWREGGLLELLGRYDGQVKVRGFRVELAEVEAAISSWPGIREAAVIVRKDGSQGERLVALIAGHDGQTIDLGALRGSLRGKLPRPMIPSQIQIVDALPRTDSGKVDRPSLAQSLPEEIAPAEVLAQPRDAVEEQLAEIWKDLLGAKSVGVKDDFFDLGGHSLLAVRLAARIQERFARNIALADLLLGTTIEELALRLRAPVGLAEHSLLVELAPARDGRPLVLVHPIGGGVLCYNALVRGLAGRAPVAAFQSAGIDDDAEPETSIERMASRYVELLIAKYPGGPYMLGGWSFGGMVAFEMARQLTEAGHDVRLVFLIDCAVPTPRQAPLPDDDDESLLAFAADLARTSGRGASSELSRLLQLDPRSITNGTIDRAILSREIAAEIGPDRLRRLHGVFRANRRALDGYSPRPYRGSLTLIEAESSRPWFQPAPTRAWSELAQVALTTYRVPGDHYTILQQPLVERLAEILAREIQAQQRTTRETLSR